MPTVTRRFSPILGKRIRVTTLDKCGAPPEAGTADSFVSTDGFISVDLSASTEDGTEIITKKADGSICVNERLAPSFKGFTMEIEFCGVDPALLSVVTNAEIYENADAIAAGIVVPEGTIDKRFAFELWTGLSGQACEEGVEEASGYMLLPYLQAGVLGNLTVNGENSISFTLTGAYTKGGNGWGVGPYNVIENSTGTAGPLPTALHPLDHFLLVETGIAPPPVGDGLEDMPE